MKGANNTVQQYAHNKKQKPWCPTDPMEKNITTVITVGHMDTTKANRTCQTHARGWMLDTRSRSREETLWGDLRTTRHAYVRKD